MQFTLMECLVWRINTKWCIHPLSDEKLISYMHVRSSFVLSIPLISALTFIPFQENSKWVNHRHYWYGSLHVYIVRSTWCSQLVTEFSMFDLWKRYGMIGWNGYSGVWARQSDTEMAYGYGMGLRCLFLIKGTPYTQVLSPLHCRKKKDRYIMQTSVH